MIFTLRSQIPHKHRKPPADRRFLDRDQALNHSNCDISHLLTPFSTSAPTKTTFREAITANDEEIVARGAEEVKCSLENGFMLHELDNIKDSPVFRNGFKPITGHDGNDEALSEHAYVASSKGQEAGRKEVKR